MATPAPALTPPPSPDGGTPVPTSPVAGASPSPPVPSPLLDRGMKLVQQIGALMVELSKSFPAAGPAVDKMVQPLREATQEVMGSQQTGEPQAPPTGG